MKNNNESGAFSEGDANLLGGYVSLKKAMQLLCCGRTTIYKHYRIGELTYAKRGRSVFIEVDSIQKFIKKNKKN